MPEISKKTGHECAKCGHNLTEWDFHVIHEPEGLEAEWFCSEVCFNTYHDDVNVTCRQKKLDSKR